jgi:hypothetical protein
MYFGRIELRGKPEEEVYERLHGYMESKGWSQAIERNGPPVSKFLSGGPVATKPHKLPHATYQKESIFFNQETLRKDATEIKTYIDTKIWPQGSAVLLIHAKDSEWSLAD